SAAQPQSRGFGGCHEGPDTGRNAGVDAMKILWTGVRAGWRAMQFHYTGPRAALHVMALTVRCLLWWVMGCILLLMAYGGLLLFYLEQMPERVASTIPDLLAVVHEVVVRWQWQCITV